MKKKEIGITNLSHANDTMKIIYGVENAVKKGVEFMNNVKDRMDLYYDGRAPSIVLEVKQYKNGYKEVRKRGGKIRVITDINKDNLEYCKKLVSIVDELRHLDNIKGGIAISEKEYMATNILHESKPLTQVVYSNVKDVVEQQQNFFDSLWNIAIPANQKFREIKDKTEHKHNDIFSVLDNEIRRNIIFYLYKNDMAVSELAKKINISLQAIQKHFPKLIQTSIIEKNKVGKLSLTNVGYALIKQIPSIHFLFENREFLKRHSLSKIPSKFLQRIGDLENMEIISVKQDLRKCEEFIDEAKKYIKLVTLQNPMNIDENSFSKLSKKKIKISHIIDSKTVAPPSWLKIPKKVDQDIQRKIVENVPVMLCVSEGSAYLMFSNLGGSIDENEVMFSKDKKFISWCDDLFDYLWKKDSSGQK